MKTIIIPTDFSSSATNALHYGLDMAKAINASVMLLHVYSVPVSYAEVPVVLVSLDEMKKTADLQMEALKKETEHLVSGSIKIYSETVLGSVADEIENCCNKIKPFAVVMGSKGASNLEKIIFGSNTLTVIRHITWPVICVPPGRIFGNGIKKIGFACDFRNVVQSTPATFIKNFAREFGAELHVLNVDYKDRHFKPDVREESLWLHTMLEDIKPVRFHRKQGCGAGHSRFC
jgi:nucleotide-binding universal stress UspA family protein